MAGDFEKLAYEAALRSLDKQESLLEGASVYILSPKKNLVFSEKGAGLYEGLYAVREDIAEVHRRLAYQLDRFWDSNDRTIIKLTRSYKVAATALVAEILSMAALLGNTIF